MEAENVVPPNGGFVVVVVVVIRVFFAWWRFAGGFIELAGKLVTDSILFLSLSMEFLLVDVSC